MGVNLAHVRKSEKVSVVEEKSRGRVIEMMLERKTRSWGILKAFVLRLIGNHWIGFEQESNMLGITFSEAHSGCNVEIDYQWARPEVRKPVRKLLR